MAVTTRATTSASCDLSVHLTHTRKEQLGADAQRRREVGFPIADPGVNGAHGQRREHLPEVPRVRERRKLARLLRVEEHDGERTLESEVLSFELAAPIGPAVELGDCPRHCRARGGGNPACEQHEELVEHIVDGPVSGERLGGVFEECFGCAPPHFEQDVFLVREMKVERALRDAGGLHDLLDGRLLDTLFEAALAPQLDRRVDELLTRPAGPLLHESRAARA